MKGVWRMAAIGLAVVIVAAGGLFVFRIRGSVKVRPSEDVETAEWVSYGQKDPAWANLHLGTSSYTMERSGCLVCCIAASLEMQGRESENPEQWNTVLTAAAALDSQGNLLWDQLPAADPEISAERCDRVDGQDMMAQLQAGRYPIVRVRVNGMGNFHYVLIVGAEDGVYQCMDPLNDQNSPVPLSRFGNRVYAVRYVDWDGETAD